MYHNYQNRNNSETESDDQEFFMSKKERAAAKKRVKESSEQSFPSDEPLYDSMRISDRGRAIKSYTAPDWNDALGSMSEEEVEKKAKKIITYSFEPNLGIVS
jgi:hypothetical protein